ncbi:MAG: NAD(P)/FAD-dependent oxidoreductase [Armatimonadetes bacterium]|nr:NAD(P)/FAD-dependent oxidoreductase [Armatimonadota bacterium]
MSTEQFEVVIVGGGTAGVDMAARLRRHFSPASIALLEPSEHHYYQPLWTLVGGGEATKEQSMHLEKDVLPHDITWIKERAAEFVPTENLVVTDGGRHLTYRFLIVAPGIKIDWAAIPGLPEALKDDPRVSSNYDYNLAEKTWRAVQNFKGGQALFTHPATPVKCGGAPQKIMYLAEDYWRIHGVRPNAKVDGFFSTGGIFPIPAYAKTLNEVLQRKEITMHFRRDLIEIRPEMSEAVFRNLDAPDEIETVRYDFMHVTPKMFPPDVVAKSPFAVADGPTKGWFKVDVKTLQNPDYPNVFALGDSAALPTSKTGAAVRKQAVVVEKNLMSVMKGESLTAEYNGYTSCPIVTGYGKLVLAEFGYDDKIMSSFPFDTTKERWSMYMLKKHGLPVMYWDLMMKGLA